MKTGILKSYIAGIKDDAHGEKYLTILRYFLPECITTILLYSVPMLMNAYFIGSLKSTPAYAALGVTSALSHFLTKVSDGFSVGTVIMVGKANGLGNKEDVGRTMRNAFWTTAALGSVIALAIYLYAESICRWFGSPEEVVDLSLPYLRLYAISVFFLFIFQAFMGFLRGIKNTRIPMLIYCFGAVVSVLVSWLLIGGNWGFPALGFYGSAIAMVLQHVAMFLAALIYLMLHTEYRAYKINLFKCMWSLSYVRQLFMLSWPVVIDKATLAAAYIWLVKMFAPMGTGGVATYNIIKDMERFALAPAVAFATIITFLVSNNMGARDWVGIKSNIKKTVFLATFFVFCVLLIFSVFAESIIRIFDKKGDFTALASAAFPLLSVLVFFDLLQIILSSALRGAGNVKTVMITRLVVIGAFFVPVSYWLSGMPIENDLLKFMLIFGSFYIGNGLMNVVYINRFRSDAWKPTGE
jgi:MATE family multidrug resistance protein